MENNQDDPANKPWPKHPYYATGDKEQQDPNYKNQQDNQNFDYSKQSNQNYQNSNYQQDPFSNQTNDNQQSQQWNYQQGQYRPRQSSKRVLAGIMGILFGGLGIHKFVLGYHIEGCILLGITLISIPLMCVVIGMLTIYIPMIIGIIEAIIYLTKTDEEFYYTYELNKKPWF